jgi:hypothetical protein
MSIPQHETRPIANGTPFLYAHDIADRFDVLIRVVHPRFMAEVVASDDREREPGDINLGTRDLTNIQWLGTAARGEIADALQEAGEFLDDWDETVERKEASPDYEDRWYSEPALLPSPD